MDTPKTAEERIARALEINQALPPSWKTDSDNGAPWNIESPDGTQICLVHQQSSPVHGPDLKRAGITALTVEMRNMLGALANDARQVREESEMWQRAATEATAAFNQALVRNESLERELEEARAKNEALRTDAYKAQRRRSEEHQRHVRQRHESSVAIAALINERDELKAELEKVRRS